MGNACSSSRSSAGMVTSQGNPRTGMPTDRNASQVKRVSKIGGNQAKPYVFADGESNEGRKPSKPEEDDKSQSEDYNDYQLSQEIDSSSEQDENGNRSSNDEEDEQLNALTRLVVFLKMTAMSLVSAGAAFYLTRKFASRELDSSNTAALSSVEAQMLPSRFSPGCVNCSMKSLNTIPANTVQQHASKSAIKGSEVLHAAYVAADNFAPPRIYHNYWAARDFPNSYYSNSPTIKNHRFTNIFGW